MMYIQAILVSIITFAFIFGTYVYMDMKNDKRKKNMNEIVNGTAVHEDIINEKGEKNE